CFIFIAFICRLNFLLYFTKADIYSFPTRRSSDLVRNIRALNGRFNTSITHAYSIDIGSKHITLNATGGGFLTASKQFRHGATSKDRKSGSAGMPRPKSYAVFFLKKKNGQNAAATE